jgi:hypothetical protein
MPFSQHWHTFLSTHPNLQSLEFAIHPSYTTTHTGQVQETALQQIQLPSLCIFSGPAEVVGYIAFMPCLRFTTILWLPGDDANLSLYPLFSYHRFIGRLSLNFHLTNLPRGLPQALVQHAPQLTVLRVVVQPQEFFGEVAQQVRPILPTF